MDGLTRGCRARSCSSRRRTRSSTRARSRSRGAARPLLPQDVARVPSLDDELQIIDDQREHHPLATLGPVVRSRRSSSSGRGARRLPRPADRALDRRARARDPRLARGGRRRVGPREPRARARRARLGAPSRPRVRRSRWTSSTSSCRCSGTVSSSRRRRWRTPGAPAGTSRWPSFRRRRPSRRPPPVERLRVGRQEHRRRMSVRDEVFPLVPRRRLIGPGVRHDAGAPPRRRASDVAGSRPYVRGDSMDAIDWAASARRPRRGAPTSSSSASTSPTRRRASSWSSTGVRRWRSVRPGFRWLRKDEALARRRRWSRTASPRRVGSSGYLDLAEGADAPSLAPAARAAEPLVAGTATCTPPTGRRRTTSRRRSSSSGVTAALSRPASFLFVLSDFLEPRRRDVGAGARAPLGRRPRRDPGPDLGAGVPGGRRLVVPLVGADGRVRAVRLEKGESRRWRERHEARLAELVDGLRSLGIEPVLVSRDDREHVFGAFLNWSMERRRPGGTRRDGGSRRSLPSGEPCFPTAPSSGEHGKPPGSPHPDR